MAPAVPVEYTGQKESNGYLQAKMMGKSRKYAMGNPGKMMPDYRHSAVEITAESEGFGSSGRVDTEMTLSEGSCSPKRKCISLNGDSHDNFGVPVQVLSLSKMSRLERKDLEVRLKRELEEVRILQRRVASLSANAVVVSPVGDIRSCSDGQKRPPLESTQRVPEHFMQGKKRLPPGRNGPRTITGGRGTIDTPRQALPMNLFTPNLAKQCENLVTKLLEHKHAWVFKEPVDIVKLNIPDYHKVIKHPMDLGSVKKKLSRGEYKSPLGFAADVRLTFSNAMTYNPRGNDVHIMAQTLSKFFEQRWKSIEKKLPVNTDVQLLPSRVDGQIRNEVAISQIPPAKKKKVAPVVYVEKLEPVKRVMTEEDKQKLSGELEGLLTELPETIIDFLKEHSSPDAEAIEDEIEIDLDSLSDDVLFKLRKLLDDFLLERKKHQAKAEPCEMELHNESGFSNSSIQPGKGNDAVDEDVDIGGNDPPISSFPPVEIEKDTANKISRCSSPINGSSSSGNDAVDEDVDIGGNDHPVSSFPPVEIEKDVANKNNRCSSPSSSSSDSGSSSSDSDSGTSSSESEGARALPLDDSLQGTVIANTNLDQNRSDVQDAERNQSRNSLSQDEQTPQTKPPSVEVEGHKEGESAPSERQVSPDKLYRAALLRSRFADTIFKAQEKTLEKGEKRDQKKLRLEREELERRQREEKARLQAEAKAAEEARRKAEAEAAAEAKRKRELEREAARLALQKMEKTVDINENCQFMEDLEMLSAAPADNLSSFMGDVSPDDSQIGGLGSFRFRGNSNPLEQLGLYRKDDDEEEEEVEAPHIAPDPTENDVEEGEID